MPEPWPSTDQITAHLGVIKDTSYTWITDKTLSAHRVDSLWKLLVNEIDDRILRGDATVPSPDEDTE